MARTTRELTRLRAARAAPGRKTGQYFYVRRDGAYFKIRVQKYRTGQGRQAWPLRGVEQ